MIEKRKQCKEQCDKEIQKIILKDKMEKQMAQQLTTLETKITTEDIPTCVCEKSIADKVEKGCLRCGYGLGSVAPMIGLTGSVAVNAWKDAALKAAIDFATKAGAAAGKAAGEAAGKESIIGALQHFFHIDSLNGTPLQSLFTPQNYANFPDLANVIHEQYRRLCAIGVAKNNHPMCKIAGPFKFIAEPGRPRVDEKAVITGVVKEIKRKAAMSAAEANTIESAKVTAEITARETALIEAGFNSSITSIYASIIAILIIVLIMVIIYLILRYWRKKKMKKKLQYIKLLEE
ncbi:hypothetical protein PFTANZ_06021 [Plasmodium falciparum Tanzania (2000708)]|uniref:Surface antigen n=1 Tax=Plasmodium falciparum Tanzania (2000708) TaxID=1036725 RepID=A0A024VZD0_PLAFA|nr:hypothetical protein PFTANZ_06021 [Plasmodium falciparum Tanzania (2000708)]